MRCLLGYVLALHMASTAGFASDGETQRDRRLVRRFDFEEMVDGRKVGRYEKLPVHWYVMGRETGIEDAVFTQVPMHRRFIHGTQRHSWGDAAYDATEPFGGQFSLRLTLNGGSVGAFLQVGAMPAIPGSDYALIAAVRTTQMEHARARLAACFVDGAGRMIEASRIYSPPLLTQDRWQQIVVRLRGDFEEANWISIQVELNQPTPVADVPLGQRQVIYQQVHGSAWFDDISVWQVPRLRIATQSSVNLVRWPQRPELSVEVRDFSGNRLTAQVDVSDHEGRTVARWRKSMGGNASPLRRWEPDLPRFGWYLAHLRVREKATEKADGNMAGNVVAEAIGSFQWLPVERHLAAGQRRRLQIVAEHLGADQLPLLPQFLNASGVGSTVISAWDQNTTTGDIESRQRLLADVFAAVNKAGGDVTVCLAPIPDQVALALDVDTDDPVTMLNAERHAWAKLLRPVVIRHGQSVRRWQLGAIDRPTVFALHEAASVADKARRQMLTMTPSPRLLLPWSGLHAPRDELPSAYGYVVDVPASVQPAWIGRYLAPWVGRGEEAMTAHLRVPLATEIVHEQRCTDLALRMVAAWKGGADRLAISRPWSVASVRDKQWMPDPRIGVFTTVGHRLAGRAWRGSLDLGEGLACEIFSGLHDVSDGMLAVWNVSAPMSRVDQAIFLGEKPVGIDLFGNAEPLVSHEGRHRFRLTREPLFIEGIDPQLALLRASFSVDPPLLESKQKRHTHTISLRNPWPGTISGELHITGLDDWMIEPRRQSFSIASGQRMQADITIMFPVSELAGAKQIQARAVFTADVSYDVRLAAPVTLGLRDVDFDAVVLLEPNPATGITEVVVTQMITNKSEKTISLYAFASMVGHPRQERLVPQLLAGQVVVRRFRFVAAGMPGGPSHVRVGLREMAGPAVLNRRLSLGFR